MAAIGENCQAVHSAAEAVVSGIFKSYYLAGASRLGDAYIAGLRDTFDADTPPKLAYAYQLVGDPALYMMPTGQTYEAWVDREFPGQGGETNTVDDLADPDGDLWRNLIEFAAGSVPTNRLDHPWLTGTVHSDGSNAFADISFQQRRWMEGVELLVETCNDVMAPVWGAPTGGVEVVSLQGVDENYVIRTVRLNRPIAAWTRLFVRLRAVRTQQ